MATIEEITTEEIEQQTADQIDIEEGSGDDDVPELEQGDAPTMGANIQKPQGRQERKARQSIKKLGLVPVTGVTRVAIRKTKAMLFVINKPDVFKNPNSDTYVVFGEAKVEDPTGQQQFRNAQQMEQMQAAREAATAASAAEKVETLEEDPVSDGDDGEVDQGDIEDKDIDLVMQQANVERAKAIKALRKNNGDIVNSIMELTI